MTNSAVRVATFDELDTRTLYALLKLRVDVFVVEQKCAYPELDDRDQEPGTRHIWLPELPALPALPAVPAVPRVAPRWRICAFCTTPTAACASAAW